MHKPHRRKPLLPWIRRHQAMGSCDFARRLECPRVIALEHRCISQYVQCMRCVSAGGKVIRARCRKRPISPFRQEVPIRCHRPLIAGDGFLVLPDTKINVRGHVNHVAGLRHKRFEPIGQRQSSFWLSGKTRGYFLYDEIDEFLPPALEEDAHLDIVLTELALNGIAILEAPGGQIRY